MAKQNDDEQAKPAKKPVPWQYILKGLFVFLNLTTLIGGGFVIYSSTVGYQPKVITEESAQLELKKKQQDLEAHPVIYTMDPFAVNLDGIPRRFIRTTVSLEMLDERGFEEVVTLGAQSRDSIVRLLNGKSVGDIETIQGKLFLKDQIASSLNQQLKTGVVKDVFFSEFVIQ